MTITVKNITVTKLIRTKKEGPGKLKNRSLSKIRRLFNYFA